MTIRILLVDDHPVVRQGLKTLLEGHSEWEVIGEAADGVEAVEKAEDLQPDVMVLDVTMPRMNGIEACRSIAPAPSAGDPVRNPARLAANDERGSGSGSARLCGEVECSAGLLGGRRGSQSTSCVYCMARKKLSGVALGPRESAVHLARKR